MVGTNRVEAHCVTLHCVRVAGKSVHPLPLVLPSTDAVDFRKVVAEQGYSWRGIFAVLDSVVDGRSHLDVAVLCESQDEAGMGAVDGLIADDWIRQPLLTAGQTLTNLPLIDFVLHHEDATPISKLADLVIFVSILRTGPSGLEIVLVEEPEKKWSPEGGRWFLPAGHVDEKETFSDGLHREVLEEAGLRVEITGLLAWVHRNSSSGTQCYGPHLLLSARPCPDAPAGADERPMLKTEPDKESLSARWWPLDVILEKVNSEEASTFFREADEMRKHLNIVGKQQAPAQIISP